MGGLIFLYGPSGAGKSAVGQQLAKSLNLTFTDLDDLIIANSGQEIPQIFSSGGEAEFRKLESEALSSVLQTSTGVVSLGGGTSLSESNQKLMDGRGQVILLTANQDVLFARLDNDENQRPLLGDDARQNLAELLEDRQDHYAAFSNSIDTSELTIEQAAWQIQSLTGQFFVSGMGAGYPVTISENNLNKLGKLMQERGLHGPIAVISDDNVREHYGQAALESLRSAGYSAELISIPAGEEQKNIATITKLWEQLLEIKLERRSTVVALGGGVIGDLSGFAAATYMRGVSWVAVPTTLLAMVDASLGGKTGIDLPAGKNLAGAFHAPSMVITDPQLLNTLPEVEMQNGMAEVVKHGIIADPELFDLCAQGWPAIKKDLTSLVRQAAAVKINTIQIDPYEKGARAALNLGHTIGHAVEVASAYSLGHGEAVSIGMVVEARLAEALGIAKPNLSTTIQNVLENLGLPVQIPASISAKVILDTIQYDKKRAEGEIRFALPENIGKVQTGVVIDDLAHLLEKL